jgi:predicted acetyltransferase
MQKKAGQTRTYERSSSAYDTSSNRKGNTSKYGKVAHGKSTLFLNTLFFCLTQKEKQNSCKVTRTYALWTALTKSQKQKGQSVATEHQF